MAQLAPWPGIASSTTTLASSILRHRIENWRLYHKTRIQLPNDEKESDRLDLQPNLFLLTTHYELGLAPPARKGSNVKRVLDCIEFGEDHPDAKVVGVDLSPVQTEFVPPNVKFEVDDTEEPWTYHMSFDYIHTRAMTFFKQSLDSLEPGGCLELQEEEACNILGRPFVNCDRYLPSLLKEAGFIDISVNKFKWPLNPWPKDPQFRELGTWQYENLVEGIEAWIMAPFTRALGWSKDEVNVSLIDVRKNMKDRGIHAYCPIYTIHARKPLEDKE
ncbi:S-adenosyl-L-methionine-dependent methyltransferase [Colletotrichum cereale]|nr:S-adenosyl-L-methionine-dependent methyltransferase [Colletotrichum cereale]